MLVSSGEVSYLGCYDQLYRAKYLKNWLDNITKHYKLEISSNYTFEGSLGEPIEIQKWIRNGLPSDIFSCVNGVIVYNSQRWPLMIDPQIQANKWIKNNELSNNLRVVKQSDNDFVRKLEDCISFGYTLLIENVGEELDSILDPILSKQTFRNSGILSMKVGDNIVSYSKTFSLFMTTKLSNPHYYPEISTKVNLVNFMITSEGLVDQLIEIAVAKERPDLEELNAKLIVQDHECKEQLQQIENNILKVLNREQNILDDEEAVQVLQQSKSLSKEIEEKYAASVNIEQKITETKVSFEPIAKHAAVLFEGIVGLGRIEYMYQYSLQWFLELYQNVTIFYYFIHYFQAFEKSEKTSFIQQKVENVCNYFTNSIFNNVCRSLFEKDKLLFTFIMLLQIQRNQQKIEENELNFIMNPNISVQRDSKTPKNTLNDLIDDDGWLRVLGLNKLNQYFSLLIKSLEENKKKWKQILDSPNVFEQKFPVPFDQCSELQRICLCKVLKRDNVVFAVKRYIKNELGENFINSPTFDLNKSFGEATNVNPLLFLLPGTDPMSMLQNFADSKNRSMKIISLGQGQGIFAERAIEEAQKQGTWVFLQNCHLSPSWMSALERICDAMDTKAGREKTHPSFRLWLSSFPTNTFPISLLQNGIKMTNEPPKGLKSNLLVSYNCDLIQDKAFFEQHQRPNEFKTLLYGLCFFHAIIQERRTFGALGWNCFYDFNQSDLRISIQQLHQFLNETPKEQQIPFNTLHYLVSECNYGGRITDDKDRLTLSAIMLDFYSTKIINSGSKLQNLDDYEVPFATNLQGYCDIIQQLPVNTPPELYGLHANAGIIREINDGRSICFGLQESIGNKSKEKGSSTSTENTLFNLAEDILEKIPKGFDENMAVVKYPLTYSNSINTVLLQELARYNQLIWALQNSLKEIINVLKGLLLPSETLEEVISSLQIGKVPELWLKKSYPSLKPLGSYISDLITRINYFNGWIFQKQPACFWISGFFFTQSFMTAILQNFARKNIIAIDKLVMTYQFFQQPGQAHEENSEMFKDKQKDCASYVYGLFLEGGSWDYENCQLIESQPKILYEIAPFILFQPQEIDKVKISSTYACPVYKTTERKGVLTTTGHSSNYITDVYMPTEVEKEFWIKRGVALICSLSE